MKRILPIAALAVVVGAFAFGLLELFMLRFQSGDVYPPYSSFRPDPLGASAFYESLEELPGLTVQRDFSASSELPDGRDLVYLHLAGQREEWEQLPPQTFADAESFMKAGGRLVLAMYPETSGFFSSMAGARQAARNARANQKKTSGGKTKPGTRTSPAPPEADGLVSITKRWGVDFAFDGLKAGQRGVFESATVTNVDEPALPQALEWHSAVVLTGLDRNWRVIYSRGPKPVLAERRFGRGSLVISTDSFFVSNEAMLKDRQPELLAWLIGPSRKVMFDEAHLGVVDQPGIAVLLRRYRLQGVIAGLLALAVLFIWKNSSSLAPRVATEDGEAFVTGKDSAAGFINLLRRHVRPGELLALCFNEWKKSFAGATLARTKLERVQAVFDAENSRPPAGRDPVRAYRDISRALKPGVVAAPLSPNPTTSIGQPHEQ